MCFTLFVYQSKRKSTSVKSERKSKKAKKAKEVAPAAPESEDLDLEFKKLMEQLTDALAEEHAARLSREALAHACSKTPNTPHLEKYLDEARQAHQSATEKVKQIVSRWHEIENV